MLFRYAFSVCAAVLIILRVNAEENTPGEWQLIGQWDNDLITGTDRDYTNGARVAFIYELDRDGETHNVLQKALTKISGIRSNHLLRDNRFPDLNAARFAWGIGLSQLMFTPEDTDALAAPNGERPYAGWLGLEFNLHTSTRQSVNSVTLSIGTTGKNSFSEETQEWVHTHISGSPIFQGWDSQVPGELTINLHVDRKQRLPFLNGSDDWALALDGYYEWGATLGNFRTDAYLGTLIRCGFNLPDHYITPRVQLGSSGKELFGATKPSNRGVSAMIFGGVRGYGVLHDITLDGPLFRNFDTGTETEPWVGEAILGIGLGYKTIDLAFSQTFRTNEFEGQAENLEFGSVMLQINFAY